jgi:hypothetical protein
LTENLPKRLPERYGENGKISTVYQGGNMFHCSTVDQRVQWVSQLLGDRRAHGLVSELSRTNQVSRQTLYRWKEKGEHALYSALENTPITTKPTMPLRFLVLTLLIETHASYRNIQSSLKKMHGIQISLGTISSVIQEAGQRAQKWLSHQQAQRPRSLALDEQYSSQRGKAYLNVIDVHSGQVWATVPPVAVDGESWTLLWWYLQEQGLKSDCTVSDGGHAIHEALSQVHGLGSHQRDVWHVFQFASQVQGRLDRALKEAEDRLPTIQRQAQRVALGQKARGRAPKGDVTEHQALIERLSYVTDGVRYLLKELHTLLEVVVLCAHPQASLLTSQARHTEIETVLVLLDELEMQVSPGLQKEMQKLSKHLRLALPPLLLFARKLDEVHQLADEQLGPNAVHLLAWAWQRRAVLDLTTTELVKSVEPAWQEMAQTLFSAWDLAVRASSAVENWHSIVRPHLAIHRTLSAGMLALLAVWHNHRIAPRGPHTGLSPLQRTDSTQPNSDWFVALGYSAKVA